MKTWISTNPLLAVSLTFVAAMALAGCLWLGRDYAATRAAAAEGAEARQIFRNLEAQQAQRQQPAAPAPPPTTQAPKP